jgi:hypothetical protein
VTGVIEQTSGQRVERWDTDAKTYTSYLAGVLVESRPFTDGEVAFLAARDADVAWQARRTDAARLLRLAYASNRDYLAGVDAGTVTNAQAVQQVAKLTRQLQGLIRLVAATSVTEDVGFDAT